MDVTVIKNCIFIWLDSAVFHCAFLVIVLYPLKESTISVIKKKSKQLSHRTKLMIYSMKFV